MRNIKIATLIFLVFLLKLGFSGYQSYLVSCANPDRSIGVMAISSGDTFSYTGAMENYVQTGKYYFFNGKEKIYAGRLPHYSIPYFIFRQILKVPLANDAVVIFQVLIGTIAIFCFYQLLLLIGISHSISMGSTLVLFLSPNFFHSDIYISPESFSKSLLVIFLFLYVEYLSSRNLRSLLFTGLILGLLVTLKAYMILTFVPIGIEFLIYHCSSISRQTILRVFQHTVLLSLPLIILLTPWTIRNYIIFKKFIPLQESLTAGYDYPSAELSYRLFVTSWGGDHVYWEKTAAGCWFLGTYIDNCEFTFPDYVFTQDYTIEDLISIRSEYRLLKQDYDKELDKHISSKFNSLTTSFKHEKPFRYYVLSPLILTRKFLVNSGSYYLPIHSSSPCYQPAHLIIKLVTSGLYWFTLIGGFIGGYMLIIRKSRHLIIILVPITIIILFPLVLRSVEWRMFEPMYPLLLLLTSLFLDSTNLISSGAAPDHIT